VGPLAAWQPAATVAAPERFMSWPSQEGDRVCRADRNEARKGNDNDTTTRWCATDGSFPQWWRVDLGATHSLVQVSIRFEYPDRKYFYLIETSADDAVYIQRITANGTGVTQTVALPANVRPAT